MVSSAFFNIVVASNQNTAKNIKYAKNYRKDALYILFNRSIICDSQELEPKIGEVLCKLWEADQVSPSGRTPRTNNTPNRRGKSGPAQPDPHPSPSQWHGTQPNLGYTAIQQVYTTHTPSLPIPVPIPSARHAIPTHYPRHQVVAAQPMAVPFGAHAVALQSQFRSASPRFPGTIVQPPHIRAMGPPSRGTRGPYNTSKK